MKILISGSMQFSEKMLEVKQQLEDLGHVAITSKFIDQHIGKSDEEKERLKLQQKYDQDAIREFWDLMQNVDALLVLNYDKNGIKNYAGGNAFLEMGFAYVLKKKIFLLNPIPTIPYYETEIIAMKPIVIDGDLSKIR